MQCPNCQSKNVEKLASGKILCPICDTVFFIEPDGAKPAEKDVLAKVTQRLDQHEKIIEKLKAGDSAEPATAQDQAAEQGDEQGGGQDDNPDGCETNLFQE